MIRFRLVFGIALASLACLPVSAAAQDKPGATAMDLRQRLLGAWVLAGDVDSKSDPEPGARLKFWGLKDWVITQSDPKTGKLIFHHGGTYTLDGDNYEETITFAAENTKEMIGMRLKFKIAVEGDTYIQHGQGNSFDERWIRRKRD